MRLLSEKDFDDIDIEAAIECSESLQVQRFSYALKDSAEAKQEIARHLKWFHKAKSFDAAPFLLGSCPIAISKLLLDLHEPYNSTQHIRGEIQVNSRCNLVELIRQHERNFIHADEALIKTYPSENFINVCKKFQRKIIPAKLQDVLLRDVEKCSSSLKFIDSIEATDYDSSEKVYGRIVIPFLIYKSDLDTFEKNAQELVKMAKARGYFLSLKDIVEVLNLSLPAIAVYLAFEAKYSKHCIRLNDVLIHCTSLGNLHSINLLGLKPGTKTRNFFSEDTRVYFFNNCKHYEIDNYANLFVGNEFAMLHMKKEKLEAYLPYATGKMRFFTDPRLQNLDDEEMPLAVYTYEPIPRHLIEDKVKIIKFVRGMKTSVIEDDLRNW